MIDFKKAQELLSTLGRQTHTESVPLGEARGRLLAEDFLAPFDLPAFDQSAMDGYAVHSEAFTGIGQTRNESFRLLGEIHAGDPPNFEIRGNECVFVSTGAALPKGAGRVVLKEEVKEEGKSIRIQSKPTGKTHIRKKGGYAQFGQRLLKKGVKLDAPALSVLAMFGRERAKVFRKPDLAILTTGNEIIEAGNSAGESQVYNSNQTTLKALFGKPWLNFCHIGHLCDDLKAMTEKFREIKTKADFLLITGGASVGKRDYVKPALSDAGFDFLFEKISVRPGKPFSLAVSGQNGNGCTAFVLPGNPGAVFSVSLALILPFLAGYSGNPVSRVKTGTLREDVELKAGLTVLAPARLIYEKERPFVLPMPQGDSGHLFSYLGCQALCILPSDICGKAGEEVLFLEKANWD